MSGHDRHERLIEELVADLRPVRRLRSPALKAFGWLAVVGMLAAALASFSDLAALGGRLASALDMKLAMAGSTLTTVLAVLAAFQTSMPDRKPAWALLPLPAALLWLGASGLGCLRAWVVPHSPPATLEQERVCLVFIIGVSVPLSVLLIAMLRRASPLKPGMTLAMGGLAAASASATLLNLFHPYDAGATDLAVHVLAVIAVNVSNKVFGIRFLDASLSWSRV